MKTKHKTVATWQQLYRRYLLTGWALTIFAGFTAASPPLSPLGLSGIFAVILAAFLLNQARLEFKVRCSHQEYYDLRQDLKARRKERLAHA